MRKADLLGKPLVLNDGNAGLNMAKQHSDVQEDKKLIKKAFRMHDKQEHKGAHTNLTKLKEGGIMAKESMGPKSMSKDVEKGSNKNIKFGQSAVQKRGLTKGKELGVSGKSVGIESEKNIKSYSKATKMAKGGGVESKGKTKGKIVKMCSGGRTK